MLDEIAVMTLEAQPLLLHAVEQRAVRPLGGERLVPIDVNGTAGFGNYHRVRPGLWEPWGIQVIEVAGGRISGHHNFLYPELFEQFGLPPRIEEPVPEV